MRASFHCGRRRPPMSWSGRIMPNRQDWAIVGGGMLGLTLASRLAQRRPPVTVFEAAPTLGGLADAWRVGDVTWDQLLPRHPYFRHTHPRSFSNELDLEQDMQWRRDEDRLLLRRRLAFDVDQPRLPALPAARPDRTNAAGAPPSCSLANPRLASSRANSRCRLAGDALRPPDLRKIWLPLLRPSSASAIAIHRRRSSGPPSPACTRPAGPA